MNIIQRITARLLAVVLLMGLFPVSARAAESGNLDLNVTYINPRYADVVTEDDLLPHTPSPVSTWDMENPVETVAEAGAELRDQMKDRIEEASVYMKTDTIDSDEITALIYAVSDEALIHTGVPTEGDYLAWQFGGWEGSAGYYQEDDYYIVKLGYTITYYTTIEQEAEVDTAVGNLLNELDVSSVSDYEKVKAVYDYICANVTYDHDNLNDDSYKLKHTAYAALIDGTAVCQGYALLLYRLALELGVDCRLIAGSTSNGDHGWNIVELDSFYYNADSTWDAGETEYDYFLKCQDNFPDHNRFEEYATSEFYAAYPMSETDYVHETVSEIIANGTCGENAVWSLSNDGTITISGEGAIYDYESHNDTPWFSYKNNITTVVVEDGITDLGYNSFAYCSSITSASLPDSLTRIGDSAFEYSSNLATVEIPDNVVTLGSSAFESCSLTNIEIPGSILKIGYAAFSNCELLNDIIIHDGVAEIDGFAFDGCTKLPSITIPATISTIGNSAFSACSELEEIIFEGSAPSICDSSESQRGSFAECILTAYYPANNATWTENVMLDYGGTITWKPYCPADHSWDEGTVTTEPTETEAGIRTYTCTACGETKTEEIPATDHTHSWDNGVVTQEPTETEPGIRTYTCTTCGETKTEEIPVHVHEYAAVITEPTCTEQGYTTYTCGCGESYVDDYLEATGHSYGDWYQTKAPTEEEVGEEQRDCANCDHSETREIDKLSPSEDPSGTCGENVTWDFEEDTGTLTISGNETAEVASARSSTNCAMDDYASAEDTPWYPYQDQITTVIIKSTVDSVGSNAFSGCSNLTTVIIEEGVSQIDDTAFADCPALETCYYEGSAEQWEELNADIGTAVVHYDSAEPEVHTETKTTVDPTCTEQGYDLYTCSCGTERRANFVDATGHSWNEGEVTKEPTPEESGIKTFTCEICGETSTEEIPYETPETSSVQRVYGESRADTALEVAKATKEALGVEKFDTIIIANGEDKNFADALTGSYLANVKSAPILMYRTSGLSESTMEYIQNNLSENGTIYLLGGESAIPASVEESLAAYTIKRLAGTSRMDTNLEILKEAGVGSEEILIARGYEFADSLSASATGKPILLVNEVTGKLTEAQITFLSGLNGNKLTILGGTLAISVELEAAIEEVVGTDVDRVYGTSREDTSVAIAKRYFEAPSFAVVAYSRKSPDGLCGGPLAYAMDAPLLLTNAGKEESANTYITETGIEAGYVLGGTLVITDETARAVFGLPENAVIAKK